MEKKDTCEMKRQELSWRYGPKTPSNGSFTGLCVTSYGKLIQELANTVSGQYTSMLIQLRLMRRLAWFLPRRALICFYRSFILPSFDYCSLVWKPCLSQDSAKLQRLQNYAARIILQRDSRSSATGALSDLGWMSLTERRNAAFTRLCRRPWMARLHLT